MIDLKELRRIALAATPGPWTWDGEDEPNAMIAKSPKHGNWKVEIITTDSGMYGPEVEDRDYIATFSPDTALALLDELERCREALSTARLVIRSRYAAERELRKTLELIANRGGSLGDVQAFARKALGEDK